MHGPPSSAASGSGPSDRRTATRSAPNQNLLGFPITTSTQNAYPHPATPQGALYPRIPSETLYQDLGTQLTAGSASSTGRIATSDAQSGSVSQHQSISHGLPGYLPSRDIGGAVSTPQRRSYQSRHANSHGLARGPSQESPKADLPRSWDSAIKTFLARAGLTQALRGFERDMLVMNPGYEEHELPDALEGLKQTLDQIDEPPSSVEGSSLERRKVDYIDGVNGLETLAPGSVNKSISQLLSRKRARNDASNQSEFLVNKWLRTDDSVSSSAARVDAKIIDRDSMMKFDVAKNDDGPLRRTVQASSDIKSEDDDPSSASEGNPAERHTSQHRGVDERLKNLEEHLAIRYVPSAPASLTVRLQLIEHHIINLEREYPPWAALHFNQPRRGWPAPPRPSPVVVPSHLTSTTAQREFSASLHEDARSSPLSEQQMTGDPKGKGRAQSSLQRAVLEKLEVQKALIDMKGGTN